MNLDLFVVGLLLMILASALLLDESIITFCSIDLLDKILDGSMYCIVSSGNRFQRTSNARNCRGISI
jgi:hypothetical protein